MGLWFAGQAARLLLGDGYDGDLRLLGLALELRRERVELLLHALHHGVGLVELLAADGEPLDLRVHLLALLLEHRAVEVRGLGFRVRVRARTRARARARVRARVRVRV